ncbi:MAG: trigger factor [Hydrogenovibrio sp.]|uniref:trigger factor n=1 Tax=Hydrogenovibrio TaxID=28884 RepID=UPI00036F8552|nr:MULTISPECIES: trigger factor [Hydrogenovibrio]MDR9497728.1 trigger factor [Hydrogenovibrio sp.]
MQVSVEKPQEGLEHTMNVTLPAESLDSKVDKKLAQMRRNVKMDGFRPGKVPMKIVKQRYGQQVFQEMMGEAVQESFQEAIQKEDLNIAGQPQIDELDHKDGQIVYTARFEVFPEVTLPDFAKLKVEKIASEITDKDVDKMIDKLREQQAAWKPANGNKKAREGDQVIMDFVGKKDGEPFEGGSAEDVPLELGSGRMIPGFEDGIVGMKKGEEKTIEVTFPDDYQSEELKGQTVTFDITVHSVQTKQMPEVDEEFVKSFGVEEGTEEALRKEIRDNMEKELQRTVDNKNRSAVMDALAEAVDLTVPQSLIDQEAQSLMQQQMQQFQQQGLKPEDLGMTPETFKPDAEKRVKIGLVLGDVIKEHKLQASDEDRRAYIEEQAASYEDPQEVIGWYAKNPNAQKEVDAILVEKQIMQMVLDQAKAKEVKKSFDEVVAPGA